MKEIVVGFRTPSGTVTTTQSFKTIQIPRLVRGKPGAWDPLVCLDWGDQFLAYLKGVVQTSTGNAAKPVPVWRVKFLPKNGVSVEMLDRAGVDDVVGGEDRVGFLPTWFFDDVVEKSLSPGDEPRAHQQPIRSAPHQASTPVVTSGWQI